MQKEATELCVQHKHTLAKSKPNKTHKQERDPRDEHPSRRCLWVAELRIFLYISLSFNCLFIFL